MTKLQRFVSNSRKFYGNFLKTFGFTGLFFLIQMNKQSVYSVNGTMRNYPLDIVLPVLRTCHTVHTSMVEINSYFKNTVIEKLLWSSLSIDLLFDYFLWWYLKDRVFRPWPIATLIAKYRASPKNFRYLLAICWAKVFQIMVSCVQLCLDANGGPNIFWCHPFSHVLT